MVRETVYFSGHVQGVGFRYNTVQVAREFAVAGWVKNLADGRVQLEVEGEGKEVDRLIAAVEKRMADFIRQTQRDRRPATGDLGTPTPGCLTIKH